MQDTHTLYVDRYPVYLPVRFKEFRSHQVDAILQIVQRFSEGYRTVMLDAPTGAGKTVIGEAVRQIVSDKGRRSMYLCTTKTLQDQFLHDFPYARVIKGRNNYPTLDDPDGFNLPGMRQVTAALCLKEPNPHNLPLCSGCDEYGLDSPEHGEEEDGGIANGKKLHCSYCHPWYACPYERAKWEALNASVAVANTAYFLAESNMVGTFSDNEQFTVVDEADTLESVIMGYYSISLGSRLLAKHKIRPLARREGVTKIEAWIQWFTDERVLEKLKQAWEEAAEEHAHNVKVGGDVTRSRTHELRAKRTFEQAEFILNAMRQNPDLWIVDGYDYGAVNLRPVKVDTFAHDTMFKHSNRHLLMSATLISDAQMAADLGIEDWATVRVDSQFPVERRKVHALGRANMTHASKETEWPKAVGAVQEIMNRHPHERILVHTVSYKLAEYMVELLAPVTRGRTLLTYTNARERESTLARFRQRDHAVLFAPSMDRGVDLPDEDVRVIVIAKVPFPNLGDAQVSKRLYAYGAEGRTWYTTQTVRSIVQMTGRGMRHANDYCVSYIIDRQFNTNVWRNGRHLLPRWWTDAIEWHV